jgi:acetyl esterase/lipase
MRLKSLGAAVAGIIAFGATQAAPVRSFPTLDRPGTVDVYPDRVTAFPGGVTGLADVVYSTITGYRPAIVDIYLPRKSAGTKPLIMYIHGGGWVGGTTRNSGATADFPKVLARLASEGFVVASLEYRLAGEAPFPAQLQDARAAVRFLKANAAKYGIDPTRVGVWGGSAGGHLTALTALTCGVTSLDVASAAAGSECVQAAVTWYGVFDFAQMIGRPAGDGAAAGLLGCKGACEADKVRAVSPLSYIDAKDPPFLLIHGEQDKLVDVSQSRAAEAAMKAVGVPVESIYIPAVDHSFIGATPADTNKATVTALNATFDFFHKQFDVKRK